MRVFLILALGGALAVTGCNGVVTSPQPAATVIVPPAPAVLKVTIPSVGVLRWNDRWVYSPQVMVAEIAGGTGALVQSHRVGSDPLLDIAECGAAPVWVPPGGTVDLSATLGPYYCAPGTISVEALTTLSVTVTWIGPDGPVQSSASIDVPR